VVALGEIKGDLFLCANASNGCFDSGAVDPIVKEGNVVYVRIDSKDGWESISADENVCLDNRLNCVVDALENGLQVGTKEEGRKWVALTTTRGTPTNAYAIVDKR
jgi:hypothetical protein